MQSVFIFIGTGIFHRVEPLVYSPFFACRMDGEFLFLFVLRFARFLISFVKKIGTRTIIYIIYIMENLFISSALRGILNYVNWYLVINYSLLGI